MDSVFWNFGNTFFVGFKRDCFCNLFYTLSKTKKVPYFQGGFLAQWLTRWPPTRLTRVRFPTAPKNLTNICSGTAWGIPMTNNKLFWKIKLFIRIFIFNFFVKNILNGFWVSSSLSTGTTYVHGGTSWDSPWISFRWVKLHTLGFNRCPKIYQWKYVQTESYVKKKERKSFFRPTLLFMARAQQASQTKI